MPPREAIDIFAENYANVIIKAQGNTYDGSQSFFEHQIQGPFVAVRQRFDVFLAWTIAVDDRADGMDDI
jgi:hypothetical protein